MEYSLENDLLKITVTTWGAQLKSVVRKSDGVEHMWQAGPLWGYHAPILFPHAGRVVDGTIHAKGKDYPAAQHGFARNMEHTLVRQSKDTIVLALEANGETLDKFPYRFRLLSTFRLENDRVHHTLTVENLDGEAMPFGIGYHPAFNVPFDDKHTPEDYELRFDTPQSPLCIGCLPTGLVHGDCYYLASNTDTIPVNEALFANDSHCMANLTAKTLGIYEKDTGRAVVCDIGEFPYTLLWSKPGEIKFVCIEPWHSLPSPENGTTDWQKKPAAAVLNPGERWSTPLTTRFCR